MSDEIIIPSTTSIEPETTPVREPDYTPGYSIRVEHARPLEGASVTLSPVFKELEEFRGIDIDPNSQDEVIGLYNKYKEVWELERGVGTPFVFTKENTEALIEMVKIYLYLEGMEGSNVYWDESVNDYVVVPHFTEQRGLGSTGSIPLEQDPYDRLAPLESTVRTIYRDPSNGYTLSDPYDTESYFIKFDINSQQETMDTYYKFRGFWVASYGDEVFVYNLENAQRLKDAINRRYYPYTPQIPSSWKTLRQAMLEKWSPNHPMLTNGVISSEKLDMTEGRALRSGPHSRLADDGENLTGWYDYGGPYATGKNRF